MLYIKNVQIIGESEIFPGEVLVKDGKIAEVGAHVPCPGDAEVLDGGGQYLSPGFIDLHVHGGGGYSAMGGRDAVVQMCEAHARCGTTSILPTTLAAPIAQLKTAMDGIREAQSATDNVHILGVHLEGPFLSPDMCGAQSPENILVPDEWDCEDLLSYWDGIKIVGAAPETKGGMALGALIRKHGAVASVAHSTADYDLAQKAFAHGYSDVTHLYNACTSCHKVGVFRHAGTVEAALVNDAVTTQVIADLRHQPEGVLRLIYKCKGPDKMYLITDGLEFAATEMREGEEFVQENGMAVVYSDGVMLLADRSCLAGSVATCDRLVRNLYTKLRLPLCDCVKMASLTPARVVGVDDHTGKIAKGYDADLLLFNEDVEMQAVFVSGKRVV
ncbi:MAG TPA: N-acetylglucosamine-6-phosphate deacetylase [Candidatus Fimenecus excrementigallinarum]|uniref:N-acetylglucosamine-6-phosphate deacetylase n=1 Tax=Candidatus Fimenecus excrementigallinarum TaxID=2840816 RepID=A0A9D1LDQ9_9FIRM|nr:N-acetylglucosamine-6-phosphate deacetylase [Candidatus Fimenecus excrementigallinarum]